MIVRRRVWDAEGKCEQQHLHFARSSDSAKAARSIVRSEIERCNSAERMIRHGDYARTLGRGIE